jgi:NTP pyrophosphatase (non-canonical NTP hydrolase)
MNLTIEQYSHMSLRTVNETNFRSDITNACMGIAGESGELVEMFKKILFHDKPLDKEKVVNELGDICFYINWLACSLGITWDEILTTNIVKLQARYPEGFNAEAANNRDLAREEAAIRGVL